ncbi:signal peptidase I [Solibacillus sp. CAU 1738]|uniref:signal peptidase I n=1 Tax=Solibacillus sp. CAU 1738 TaxID=3140363 RepID=UPI003260EB26
MHEQLKTLKDNRDIGPLQQVTFTEQNKKAVLRNVHLKKKRRFIVPQFVLALFSVFVIAGIYLLMNDNINQQRAVETITDSITSSEVLTVPISDNLFTIEWLSDAMDRGNHDFETSAHDLLVIDPTIRTNKRGDVIYYQMPEEMLLQNPNIPTQYLGRIVALPGESIEIINGQVWIDGKILNTFYGKATKHGLDEEAYFNKVDESNIVNAEETRKYFSTSAPLTNVKEGEVYILVDQWWRGTDSRHYGALDTKEIIGVVLGYEQ